MHFVGTDAFRKISATAIKPSGPATLARVQSEVFVKECAPCHVGSSLGGLDLGASDALQARRLMPSQQDPSMPLVTPGDLSKSYLWHKINQMHVEAGGTGEQMPPSGNGLPQEELDLVRAWIL